MALSHIYKDACSLAQAKGLPSLIYHEPALEARFVRGAAGTTSFLTIRAVNCRNFYVHGGDASLDYNANFDRVTFFTQTLEFVFAASDLVEAGWDIKAWSTTGTTMSHPFTRYRINYAQELQALKALLA